MRQLCPKNLSLEQLESRTLMAAVPYAFAVGGIRFDDGPRIFVAEGTVNTDDTLSGSVVFADATSASVSAPLDWTAITRGENGRVSFTTRGGFSYAAQDGGQFIAAEGYNAGYLIGRNDGGDARDFAVFVQPNTFSSLSFTLREWLKTDYLIVSYCAITSEGVQIIDATVVPQYEGTTFLGFDITYFFPSGAVTTPRSMEASATPAITRLVSGESIFTVLLRNDNGAVSNFFMADTDPTDGIVGFGLAYARFQSPPHHDVPQGILRGAILTSGPESAGFFGLTPAPAGPGPDAPVSVIFEMKDSGTFLLYRAGEYDSGLRVPISQGTWRLRDNFNDPNLDRHRLELRDASGRVAVMRPSRAPAGLMIAESVISADGSVTEDVFGMAAGTGQPLSINTQLEELVVQVDSAGHPLVYQWGTSNAGVGWYSGDLLTMAGGEPVAGAVYSWHETSYRVFTLVGKSASGDLQMWRRFTGFIAPQWEYVNLTQTVVGARRLGGEVAGTTSSALDFSPLGVILSTDENGAYVAYVEGVTSWRFIDVEAMGFQGEGVRPELVGPLAGYGTTWGGFNFAGLDSHGEIWAIWWAPGIGEQWSTDNLSRDAGGVPRIVSHLAATTTAWGTFHITGLDENGHLIGTWWDRTLGWQFDDLTALIGGPVLSGMDLVSNFNPVQAVINVVGTDASGYIRVYWWSVAGFWQVGTPGAGVDPALRPATPLAVDAFRASPPGGGTLDSYQSIAGANSEGDVVRLYWRAGAADQWLFENLTDIAQPL